MTVPPDGRPDAISVLLPGPWAHRDISANGVRLHAAEAGDGPLVLLLHGFPQFWWTWRAQLTGLAEAGFRVVAPDLRGYGASDKPPRGYDLPTLSSDVAALVRALGERDAVVVGHDWGGLLGWTAAALHPRVVRRLVVVSMAHPRLLRAGLADRGQRRALRHALGFQVPRLPERRLTRLDDDPVADLMRRWAGPEWARTADFAAAVERYRSAARIPQAAYGAMEYYRWAGRSQLRPDGLRYARRMAAPVTAPTLQLHGGADPYVLPRTARGSGRYVAGAYEWRELPGIGHFPQEEAPEEVTRAIADWAR
ncbi:alpha/beta hydrolase [Blastococcus sp. MG754426]|uniref:alpha/beta fold hydrolase n=1 Tax=unclassified Blastococcus TaxID=2619396 RepID=UPI001EF0C4E2|nr:MULTISPECIES: alpha/beta hydrolase [unclassified Blastococcus]MCF6509785.1 alpha/beta hydrolase [Blastococcus sp. MG754426]MCF6514223.1 alpha/beta hydrolase [Blastococcus sp. MG754427]MCF6737332.1 alpha/beta hydrolase [Blastococcus sp. KM273129]